MQQIIVFLLIGYIVLMSLIGFTIMGVDKRKAIKKVWRIPEKVLIGIAFIGGGIGSFLGMYAFRHKTRHTKFVVLLPIAAVLYVYALYQIYKLI
jgi:uncharacterized membrane protein YsdA (DUF1294 family)